MKTEPLVAVTGATGHLGLNLVLTLLRRGYRVRALSHQRQVPSLLQNRGALSWQKADIVQKSTLAGAFDDCLGVFHLAGQISLVGDADGSVHRQNVLGTKHVAEAALESGVRRLVHCGSVHALEHPSGAEPLHEGLPLVSPTSKRPAYDRSKALGLAQAEELKEHGLEVTSLLPSGVIGPHDPAPSRMGRVFQMLAEGTLPALTEGGFDFVDVRDVASGMVSAFEHTSPRPRYILGGHFASIRELAHIAEATTGISAPRFVTPLALATMTAPLARAWAKVRGKEPLYTPESIATLRAGRPTDFSLAAHDLNYHPRPLGQTIADLYESFRDPTRILL